MAEEYTKGELKAKGHNIECVRDGIKIAFAHCGLMPVKYSDRRGYVEAIHKKRNREVKANAQRLAKCYNCHDDLLAACEKADKALNICLRYFLGTGPQPDPDDLSFVPAILQAAIAKAKL